MRREYLSIYLYFISFISILWFSVYKSFLSLVKFLPKHFILFDAILKFVFPRWLSGKESICQAGDTFNPWVRKIPWRRKWQSTPVFFPWRSHGQRSPVGYSPRGLKESGITQWLNSNSSKVSLFYPSKKSALTFIDFFLLCF